MTVNTATTAAAKRAGVEAILSEALATGKAELGVLSDDQECVLGRGYWTMADPAVWLVWTRLEEQERYDRSVAAVAELLATGDLVVPDTAPEGSATPGALEATDEACEISPWLALVTQARRSPAFTVTMLGRVTDPSLVFPLGYAVADEVGGLRGFVTELRAFTRHDYQFLTPARFANGVAQWAYRAAIGRLEGIEAGSIAVTVFCHPQGLALERLQVILEPIGEDKVRIALQSGTVIETDAAEQIAAPLLSLFGTITSLAAVGQVG